MANKFEMLVKHIEYKDGERHKILCSADDGIPVFYPTLFITNHVRGAGLSVSTTQVVITSIKVLYAWMDCYQIDLEDRFKNGLLLSDNEIISLRDFSKTKLSSVLQKSRKASKKKFDLDGVGKHTHYARMTYISEYIEFLARKLNVKSVDKGIFKKIDAMCHRIKSHRPVLRSRVSRDKQVKIEGKEIIDLLFDVIKPGSDKNPFINCDVQCRNFIMFSILRELGIRRGELLNLRVEDVDFLKDELKIRRRADSKLDPRRYQPLVKTRERSLLMSKELSEQIFNYVKDIRSKFASSKKHPYLFVSHKEGPSQGMPLSNSGFGRVVSAIQQVCEELRLFHPHFLRHEWNRGFSNVVDESDEYISPEKEEQIRSYLMGWSQGSGTAATYNSRHIMEKARSAVIQYQENIKNKDDI